VGLAEDIDSLVRPVLTAEGMDLVEVQFRREGSGWVLRFFIDKEGGVGLNDCSLWSHKLDELVEGSGLLTMAYAMEVSSPGLARPLKKTEDFERFKGIDVIVKTFAPINNQRNFHGRIEKVESDRVFVLDRTHGLVEISIAGVASARLDPEIS